MTYPPHHPPPPYRPGPPPQVGTTGLVLGIITLVTGIVPFFTAFAVPIGVCGVVVSAVGLRRARRGAMINYGTTLAGLILSIIGIVFSVMLFLALMHH